MDSNESDSKRDVETDQQGDEEDRRIDSNERDSESKVETDSDQQEPDDNQENTGRRNSQPSRPANKKRNHSPYANVSGF